MRKLLLIFFLLSALLVSAEAQSQQWYVEEELDPIFDTYSLFAYVEADTHSGYSYDTLALVIRIQQGELEAFVVWDYIISKNFTIFHRFDQGTPESIPWQLALSSEATFHPNPAGFITDCLNSERLVIRIIPSSGESRTAEFNLTGFREVYNKYKKEFDSLMQ